MAQCDSCDCTRTITGIRRGIEAVLTSALLQDHHQPLADHRQRPRHLVLREARIQIELARSGDLPVKRAGFEDPQAVAAHRLLPIALAQLDSGCTPRPRTPDWTQAETIIGTALNEALVNGTDGSAELDKAAKDVKALFQSLGYYG